MRVRPLCAAFILMTLIPALPAWSAQDEKEEPPKLLGQIEAGQLGEEPYAEWYRDGYVDYQPNPAVIEQLQAAVWDGVEITAFFGTWCGDSQREVPRLVKILDLLEFPGDHLTLVAVDHVDEATKKSPGGEEKGMEVVFWDGFTQLKDMRPEAAELRHGLADWQDRSIPDALHGQSWPVLLT